MHVVQCRAAAASRAVFALRLSGIRCDLAGPTPLLCNTSGLIALQMTVYELINFAAWLFKMGLEVYLRLCAGHVPKSMPGNVRVCTCVQLCHPAVVVDVVGLIGSLHGGRTALLEMTRLFPDKYC